jgi:polysaccharide export outer membrane protein
MMTAPLLAAALLTIPGGPFSVGVAHGQPAPVVAAKADYRLGSGDEMRLITFGEESLSGLFAVNGSGQVSLPLVGNLQAAGLTVPEFQRAVEAALKQGFMENPRVSVEVIKHRPFYILGEVEKPGEYPYKHGLTVLEAVATASGFTYRANTKRVVIKHDGGEPETEQQLDSSTPVEPGDTIRIKERFF